MSIDVLRSLTEKKEALEKEISEAAEAAFKKTFAEFFKAHPEVKSVSWRQGTPGFNDGDPCTFSRHELEMTLAPALVPFLAEGLTIEDAEAAVAAGIKPPVASEEELDEDDGEGDYDLVGTIPNPKYAEYSKAADAHYEATRAMRYDDPRRLSYSGPPPQDERLDRTKSPREAALAADFDAICELDESLFEAAFGDPVKVRATRKGISTDEYDPN